MSILIKGISKEDVIGLKSVFREKVIELPPHGRLIDADALDSYIYNDVPLKVFGNIARMTEMRNIVCNAPTIIEAEVENDNP